MRTVLHRPSFLSVTAPQHVRTSGTTDRAQSQRVIPTAQISSRTRQLVQEHLRHVQELIPCDAAQLIGYDRFSGKHVELAQQGYPHTSAYALCVDFPRDWPKKIWHSIEENDPLPPTVGSEKDVPGSFQRSRIYTEVLVPDGFRDGVSVELVFDRQRVGLLHVSSTQGDFYDTELRIRARAAGALLGHIVSGIMVGAREIPAGSVIGMLGHGGTWTSPPMYGADTPVSDPALASIIAPLLSLDLTEASFLWQHGRTWFRVNCEVVSGEQPLTLSASTAQGDAVSGREQPEAADARRVVVVATPTQRPADLTPAEVRVLTLMIVCPSNEAIAQILGVSDRTVHTHVGRILEKLGCEKRTQAVVRAVRASIFSPFEHPTASLASLLG